MVLLAKSCHDICKHFKASSLARACESDEHDSESDQESLMELDNFLLEDLVV